MLNNLGLIDKSSSFSLSTKETSHLTTNYFRVENFGFLKLTSNEQFEKTWYPTPNDIVEAGWLTLDGQESISGDFNNDGLMDLVFQPMLFPHFIEHKSSIKPIFLFQNSNGSFSDPLTIIESSSFPDKHFLYRLESGDFNNDGFMDVAFSAMATRGGNTVDSVPQSPLVVFGGNLPKLSWTDTFDNLNLREGAPNWQLGYSTGHSMAVGDFNKDGYSDWFSQWYVSYGENNNKFNAQVVTPNDLASKGISPWTSQWTWPTVNAAVAADINEDGYDDLIVSTMPNPSPEINGGDLWLLFGSSSGLQGSSTTRSIGRVNDIPGNIGTNFMEAQDFNGDGHIDLIYLEHYWTTDSGDSTYYYSKGKLKLQLGDGTGNFKDQSDLIKDPHSGHRMGEGNIHAMDINGDGWTDLVLTGFNVAKEDGWGSLPNEKTSIFLNIKGQLEYVDPENIAFVSSYQFAGDESLKPFVNNTVGKLLPIDIGADGLIDFVGFTSTQLREWPQNEQIYTYAYIVKSLAPLGRLQINETLEGTANGDKIWGYDGNDRVIGKKGNDSIDGGLGFDIAQYSGTVAGHTISVGSTSTTVLDKTTNRDGFDTLTNIERLEFSDTSLALDIAGNAGMTAKLLGATFGKASIANKALVGIGLSYMDAGTSYSDLMGAVINAVLGSTASNAAVVELLYTNVIGSAPSSNDLAFFTDWLDKGIYTKASFGVLAADTELNIVNVGLVGLASTGLEYTPYVA